MIIDRQLHPKVAHLFGMVMIVWMKVTLIVNKEKLVTVQKTQY